MTAADTVPPSAPADSAPADSVQAPPPAKPLDGRADARRLARTRVADPYRGQLSDPFLGQEPPAEVALFTHPAMARAGARATIARPATVMVAQIVRRKAPSVVVALGIGQIILGVGVGVLGLLVIALVNVLHNIGTTDRSFYQGSDASYLLMGFLDFGVAALLIAGAISMLTGRLIGRLACTAGNWTVLGFSVYWWGEGPVPVLLPASLLVAATGALLLGYQRSVSRWLGVVPPPQPE